MIFVCPDSRGASVVGQDIVDIGDGYTEFESKNLKGMRRVLHNVMFIQKF